MGRDNTDEVNSEKSFLTDASSCAPGEMPSLWKAAAGSPEQKLFFQAQLSLTFWAWPGFTVCRVLTIRREGGAVTLSAEEP